MKELPLQIAMDESRLLERFRQVRAKRPWTARGVTLVAVVVGSNWRKAYDVSNDGDYTELLDYVALPGADFQIDSLHTLIPATAELV